VRILALESSLYEGSIAALDSGKVLREIRLDPAQRTARSFAPALAQLLRDVGWKPKDVQLVAVATGPGSFTGLRVGVTAAKVFAFAVKAEVVAVDTLEVIAAQVPPGNHSSIMAVVDAQREELFLRSYLQTPAGHLGDRLEFQIISNDAWIAELDQLVSRAKQSGLDQIPVTVTGPGLIKLVDRIPASIPVTPSEHW